MIAPAVLSRRRFLTVAMGTGAVVVAPPVLRGGSLFPLAFAQSTDQQIVITDALNVRSGAGLEFSVISVIFRGAVVTLASAPAYADGYEWIEVEVEASGVVGWVVTQYLGLPDDGGSGEFPAGSTFHVDVDAANLRTGPGLDFGVIRTLPSASTGTILSGPRSANGYAWYEVTVGGDGQEGWLADVVIAPGDAPTPSPGYWPAGTRVYVNTDRLNLRSVPSVSGSVVNTYPGGYGATVLDGPVSAGGYTWYPVEVDDGSVGWFAGDFLSTAGPTPRDRIQVTNGPLNLRSEPSLSGSVITSLSTGTYATVLSTYFEEADGYSWILVQLEDGSGRQGWVASAFVSYIDVG